MATNALMYRQHAARCVGSEHAAEANVKLAQLKSKGQSPTAVAAGLAEKKKGEASRSRTTETRPPRRRGIWLDGGAERGAQLSVEGERVKEGFGCAGRGFLLLVFFFS